MLHRRYEGMKSEDDDEEDGGFKRRPKLRTTIALDQRYTWAGPPHPMLQNTPSGSKYHPFTPDYRIGDSIAAGDAIQSCLPDRYPVCEPGLHFVQQQQQQGPTLSHASLPAACQIQQPLNLHHHQPPGSLFQVDDRSFRDYPPGIHAIPDYQMANFLPSTSTIQYKRPSDVSCDR